MNVAELLAILQTIPDLKVIARVSGFIWLANPDRTVIIRVVDDIK